MVEDNYNHVIQTNMLLKEVGQRVIDIRLLQGDIWLWLIMDNLQNKLVT